MFSKPRLAAGVNVFSDGQGFRCFILLTIGKFDGVIFHDTAICQDSSLVPHARYALYSDLPLLP